MHFYSAAFYFQSIHPILLFADFLQTQVQVDLCHPLLLLRFASSRISIVERKPNRFYCLIVSFIANIIRGRWSSSQYQDIDVGPSELWETDSGNL